MAKIKKKRVSSEATRKLKKEKKGLLHNKLFLCIAGAVLVVGITLAIVLPIVLNQSSTVEVPDYFGEKQTYTDTASVNHDVTFTKSNYSNVLQHTNANKGNDGAGVENANMFVEYVMVFATNLSSFYPKELKDNNGDDLKVESHEKTFNALVQLQYEIDKYNANSDKKVALYIVDTQASTYSENSGILTNTSFGGSDSGSDVLLFLYTRDGLKKNYKTTATSEENLFANSFDGTILTAVNNLVNYMRADFVVFEDED